MERNLFLVKLQLRNPDNLSVFVKIIEAEGGFEILGAGSEERPDLLVFELGANLEEDFRTIQTIISMDQAGEVFLTSSELGPEILLKAIRIGAKEFLSQPLSEGEVGEALARFKARDQGAGSKDRVAAGRIVNVIGSKGGVGNTTVAVNVAASLAQRSPEQSVVLMDMNVLFGDVPLFLDLTPKSHWGDIISNISRLDATFLKESLTRHSSGLYVLPAPNSVNHYSPETPDLLERLLGLMKRMFSAVVIDGGQSLGDLSLRFLEVSDQILLVSILSLPCLANAKKLLTSLRELRHPAVERMKIVVNRYLKNADISLKHAKENVSTEIFWTIPNDYRTTMAAINQGKPLLQAAPKAPITRSIVELADAVARELGR